MKSFLILIITFFTLSTFAAQTSNGSYVLDKDHANIGFSVSHLGFSNVIGRFNNFSGNINFEASGNSSVEFSIEAKSVDTNQKKRDEHIRNDDLFDVETYPTIDFKSTNITYTNEGDPLTISGNMNFHGENKPITFSVEKIGAGESRGQQRAGYKAKTIIKRSDFGIEGFKGVIGEEIEVTVNLEIIKE